MEAAPSFSPGAGPALTLTPWPCLGASLTQLTLSTQRGWVTSEHANKSHHPVQAPGRLWYVSLIPWQREHQDFEFPGLAFLSGVPLRG